MHCMLAGASSKADGLLLAALHEQLWQFMTTKLQSESLYHSSVRILRSHLPQRLFAVPWLRSGFARHAACLGTDGRLYSKCIQ